MSLNLPQTMELRNINEGFFSCGINLRIIKFSCQRQFTKESPICCLKATISGSVVLTPVSFNNFLLTILTIDTYNPSAAHTLNRSVMFMFHVSLTQFFLGTTF